MFIREIDGYRCESSHIKGECSRVQIAPKKLYCPFFFSSMCVCVCVFYNIESTYQLVGYVRFFLSHSLVWPTTLQISRRLQLRILNSTYYLPSPLGKMAITTKFCCTQCRVHSVVKNCKQKSISYKNLREFVK